MTDAIITCRHPLNFFIAKTKPPAANTSKSKKTAVFAAINLVSNHR